ncbi:hypothetical protein BDR26DRAFT_877422 [Obelidium mucronatum]|nr:hypothetical protein BDR26DRAFT_877422 [Obelidium mucronatum]
MESSQILGLFAAIQAQLAHQQASIDKLCAKVDRIEQTQLVIAKQIQLISNKNAKFHTQISDVPSEVIAQVFTWMHPFEAASFRRLSKAFNRCLTTNPFCMLSLKQCPEINLNRVKYEDDVQKIDHVLFRGHDGYRAAYASLFASKLTTIEIGLSYATLIPKEIGSMAALKKLDLSACRLFGTIPQELGTLSNLIVLSLHTNNLHGDIPSTLGNLSRLERLFLQENHLTGHIPKSLSKLASLKSFLVSKNRLTGSIPIEIVALKSLEVFFVSGNQFDAIPIRSQIGPHVLVDVGV